MNDEHTTYKLGQSTSMRQRERGNRRLFRLLTHNLTLLLVGVGVMVAVVVNFSSLGVGKADPPPVPPDLSANDMLAQLTDVDMDPITANAVAMAKKRAYEQQLKAEALAKVKARQAAKNRPKIEASKTASYLAKINPSAKQNKAYGKQMSALKGWGSCWKSLETLWFHESGWNERAVNPSSGAYGIPQALPGSKLASAGSDWKTSAPTQIAWGLSYIKARYKDPCGAWDWWQAHNWY